MLCLLLTACHEKVEQSTVNVSSLEDMERKLSVSADRTPGGSPDDSTMVLKSVFLPEEQLVYYLDDYLIHKENLEQTPGVEDEELSEMLETIRLHYISMEQTFAEAIARPYIDKSPETYLECRVCEAQTICQCERCGGTGMAWDGEYGKYKYGAPCEDTGSGVCHACGGQGVEPNPEYILYMATLLARSSKTGEMMFQFDPDDYTGDSPADRHDRNYTYLTLYECVFCDQNDVTINGHRFCVICGGMRIAFRRFHEPVTPAELSLMIEEEEAERLRNEAEWLMEQAAVEQTLLEWEKLERELEELDRELQALRERNEQMKQFISAVEEDRAKREQEWQEINELLERERTERLWRQVMETNMDIQRMSLAKQAEYRNAEYAAMEVARNTRPTSSWDILAGTMGSGVSLGTGSGNSSFGSGSGSGLSQRLCQKNDCWSYAASSTTSYCHEHQGSVSFQRDCATLGCSSPPEDGSRYCATHK